MTATHLKKTLIATQAIRWGEDAEPKYRREPLNPHALPRDFGGLAFRDLMHSIGTHGQLHPVFVVRTERTTTPGRNVVKNAQEPYTVLCGHYRLWACIALGKKVVEAVIVADGKDIAAWYGIPEHGQF